MTKKLSESFPPEKLTRMSAGDIKAKALTDEQRSSLRKIRQRQEADDDSQIDYSDIPALSDEQLASFRRRAPKALTAVRLDPDILDWLKTFDGPVSTRINGILRQVMSSASKSVMSASK